MLVVPLSSLKIKVIRAYKSELRLAYLRWEDGEGVGVQGTEPLSLG